MTLLNDLTARLSALESAVQQMVQPGAKLPVEKPKRKLRPAPKAKFYARPFTDELKRVVQEAWTQFKLTRLHESEQITMKDLIDICKSINSGFPSMTGDVNESIRAVLLEEEGLHVRYSTLGAHGSALNEDTSDSDPTKGDSNV